MDYETQKLLRKISFPVLLLFMIFIWWFYFKFQDWKKKREIKKIMKKQGIKEN